MNTESTPPTIPSSMRVIPFTMTCFHCGKSLADTSRRPATLPEPVAMLMYDGITRIVSGLVYDERADHALAPVHAECYHRVHGKFPEVAKPEQK